MSVESEVGKNGDAEEMAFCQADANETRDGRAELQSAKFHSKEQSARFCCDSVSCYKALYKDI